VISLVTGTYNRIAMLQRMVASARRSSSPLTIELIVVDGGSTDGTQEWCKTQSDIVLIEQGELLGACKAFNAGFAIAKSDYIVSANDDVEFWGNTLALAAIHLDQNPECGQVAFHNKAATQDVQIYDLLTWNGYLYGQCCLTRKSAGDAAGWWGTDCHTYAGDAYLGLRLWELGWTVESLPECSVMDYQAKDNLREINHQGANDKGHPDNARFLELWQDRLPQRQLWIERPAGRLTELAKNKQLRSLRFKIVPLGWIPRTGLINALSEFGIAEQINQDEVVARLGQVGFQSWAIQRIKRFDPDLIIFQAHGPDNIQPATVRQIRQMLPKTVIANFNGDVVDVTPWHVEMVEACDVSLLISPDIFRRFGNTRGNLAYWPISYEPIYETAERKADGGIVFLGTLFGEGRFPEAERRRDSVVALSKSGLPFEVFGNNWQKVGVQAFPTLDNHKTNLWIYEHAKLALSISQSSDLWGYSSDRLYMITATGCPAMVKRFRGMEEHGFIDGDTCIVWEEPQDLLDKARYWLAHDEEREAIGRRGRELTTTRHNWRQRVIALLEICEDIA
jgi:hypothetical protein